MTTRSITAASITHNATTGLTLASITWSDGWRTSGKLSHPHIRALVERAERDGVKVAR